MTFKPHLNWITDKTTAPKDRSVCLIVLNNALLCGVFAYSSGAKHFFCEGVKIKPAEIDAWLPLPAIISTMPDRLRQSVMARRNAMEDFLGAA